MLVLVEGRTVLRQLRPARNRLLVKPSLRPNINSLCGQRPADIDLRNRGDALRGGLAHRCSCARSRDWSGPSTLYQSSIDRRILCGHCTAHGASKNSTASANPVGVVTRRKGVNPATVSNTASGVALLTSVVRSRPPDTMFIVIPPGTNSEARLPTGLKLRGPRKLSTHEG